MGAVRQIFSILTQNKGKKPTHTTINLPASCQPCHPTRSGASNPRTTSWATRCPLESVRFDQRGQYDRFFPSSHEIRQKKANTHDNQSVDHIAGHAPPPPGLLCQKRVPHLGRRGVRLIWFHLRRGWRTTSAFIIMAQNKAKKSPPTPTQQSTIRCGSSCQPCSSPARSGVSSPSTAL